MTPIPSNRLKKWIPRRISVVTRRWLVLAVVVYAGAASVDAGFRYWDTLRTETKILFPETNYAISIQYPNRLTVDGPRHQGRLTIRLHDNVTDAGESNPHEEAVGPDSLPIPTLIPTYTPAVVGHGNPPGSADAPQIYLVYASHGINLISSDSVSQLPISVTLGADVREASLLIEHANLQTSPIIGEISIRHSSNGQPQTARISLEQPWVEFLRKWLGAVVVSVAAVISILFAVEESRRQEEEKRQREESVVISKMLAKVQDVRTLRQFLRELSERTPSDDLPEDVCQRLEDRQQAATIWTMQPGSVREFHTFLDLYWAGIYFNKAWIAAEDRQDKILEQIQTVCVTDDDYDKFMAGLYDCDTNEEAGMRLGGRSLLREIAKQYGSDDSLANASAGFFDKAIQSIDRIASARDSDNAGGFEAWTKKLQHEQRKHQSGREQYRYGRRLLWPVKRRVGSDANYDFSAQSQDQAEEPTIDVTTDQDSAANTNIEGLCPHLDKPVHCFVIGPQKAGKTWLRIYFEREYDYTSRSLSIFFFLPVELLYNPSSGHTLRHLASSIANYLAAVLIEEPAFDLQEQETRKYLQKTRQTIPFLCHYGYKVATGINSLNNPTPPAESVDLEQAYRQSIHSSRFAELEDMMSECRVQPCEASDEYRASIILQDIKTAVKAAEFDRLYVFIDNLDAAEQDFRNTFWKMLSQPDFLWNLAVHGIYLKVFTEDDHLVTHLRENVLSASQLTETQHRNPKTDKRLHLICYRPSEKDLQILSEDL